MKIMKILFMCGVIVSTMTLAETMPVIDHLRAKISYVRITPEVEADIQSKIDEWQSSEEDAQKQIIKQSKKSIRSLLWKMEDMQFYYAQRQIQKPVLGAIMSHVWEIEEVLMGSDTQEQIIEIETLIKVYFDDLSNRYAIHREREQNARNLKNQTAIEQLGDEYEVPAVAPSDTYQSIVIDLSEQRIYAFEDGILVMTSAVTTGKRGFSTPQGDFAIQNKKTNVVLNSPFKNIYYKLNVDYWIPFNGSYGIHDACNDKSCWRTKFGGKDYTSNGSHGCVNTPYDAVKWVYDWSLIGTRVRVQA